MGAPAMHIDFAPRRDPRDAAGLLVLVAGVAAFASVVMVYQQTKSEAEGLQLRADAYTGTGRHAETTSAAAPVLIANAGDVVTELATPWSRLLTDLGAASVDSRQSVALLAIEPDVEHRRIRIVAESRDLPAALAYTERLQRSPALRFPLLVSHEVQTKDQYQPVRFEIAAEWRVAP
jgi:hypothetical protein